MLSELLEELLWYNHLLRECSIGGTRGTYTVPSSRAKQLLTHSRDPYVHEPRHTAIVYVSNAKNQEIIVKIKKTLKQEYFKENQDYN